MYICGITPATNRRAYDGRLASFSATCECKMYVRVKEDNLCVELYDLNKTGRKTDRVLRIENRIKRAGDTAFNNTLVPEVSVPTITSIVLTIGVWQMRALVKAMCQVSCWQ